MADINPNRSQSKTPTTTQMMDLTSAPHTDVAGVILADGNGRFLLQRRDQSPAVSNPGLIGMFGGHKEGAESDIDCALREVYEETNIKLSITQLALIVRTRVQFANGIIRAGTFFFSNGIDEGSMKISEGTLCEIPYNNISRYFCEMVPTTAYVMSLVCELIRNHELEL
ncbi:NUDIX domain-containing protein [Oricola indica]|uniref:NUDIX domain-containing protein n=1 Tax=Oricola indica TaxID=2872591 RepID=UPI003CCBC704